MFIKSARFLNEGDESGSPSSLEQNFNAEANKFDPQKLNNELHKYKRLYEKTQKEMEGIKGELGSIKPMFDQFKMAFGGQKQEEGEKPLSYLDKVRQADKQIREQNPESGGISLTLEAAEKLEALERENADLKKRMGHSQSPENTAAQSLFVRLEHEIKEKLYDMFPSEELADSNYPDYERVAIEKLKAIQANKREWMKLLNDPTKVRDLAETIFSEKMPRMDKVAGWHKIETYSFKDAEFDLARAEKMSQEAVQKQDKKMWAEAAALQKKARPTWLAGQLGIDIKNK